MLQLAGLAIARGGRTLLRDIDAVFAPGTFTALMGANGVGKTTLLATMCGVLAPASGSVMLDGADIATLDARSRAQRMALVEPTEAELLNALNNSEDAPEPYGIVRVERAVVRLKDRAEPTTPKSAAGGPLSARTRPPRHR